MNDDKMIITPKKPKGEDGYKIFSVRLKDDLIIQLESISKKTGRSRNELIGKLLEFALDKCVIQEEED